MAFFSGKLFALECNYTVYEREIFPIQLATHHWKCSLYNRITYVYTVHQTPIHLFNQLSLSPKLIYWVSNLADSDLHINYRSGKKNQAAHALSRIPIASNYLHSLDDIHICAALV